jgi:hypothetical protein
VEEYVEYVLTEVLHQTAGEFEEKKEKGYTSEEEKEVKERLENLGYLD